MDEKYVGVLDDPTQKNKLNVIERIKECTYIIYLKNILKAILVSLGISAGIYCVGFLLFVLPTNSDRDYVIRLFYEDTFDFAPYLKSHTTNDLPLGLGFLLIIFVLCLIVYAIKDGDLFLDSAVHDKITWIPYSIGCAFKDASFLAKVFLAIPVAAIMIPFAIYYMIVIPISFVLNLIYLILQIIFDIEGRPVVETVTQVINELVSIFAILVIVLGVLKYFHIM